MLSVDVLVEGGWVRFPARQVQTDASTHSFEFSCKARQKYASTASVPNAAGRKPCPLRGTVTPPLSTAHDSTSTLNPPMKSTNVSPRRLSSRLVSVVGGKVLVRLPFAFAGVHSIGVSYSDPPTPKSTL